MTKISELESPEIHIGLSDLKYYYEDKYLYLIQREKKDMLAFCQDGTISEEYHSYHNNIPFDSSVKEVVPEPDLYHEMSKSEHLLHELLFLALT